MKIDNLISLFKKLDLTAKLLVAGIVAAIILPPITSTENSLSASSEGNQNVNLPTYSSFSTRNTDPQIILQTFDAKDVVCLNWFHDSGTSYSLYCTIKNGNKLYDSGGSNCGYLIVKGDGSIVIKGWRNANGHYYGIDGAKATKR